MLHLFANYRYGVHEEHGFVAQSDKFTYTFMNPHGDWQVTGCNNTKIEGEYKDSYVSNNKVIKHLRLTKGDKNIFKDGNELHISRDR